MIPTAQHSQDAFDAKIDAEVGSPIQFLLRLQWFKEWVGMAFIFINPSKIEWDLPNGPLTKLLELLDTKV